jgi:hypothetical protein
MGFRKWAFDEDEHSIRGSFVNTMITFIYVALIGVGAAFDKVADNVEKMATFLIGFFAVSFSVWAGKKIIENIQDVSTVAGTVSDTLTKLGIKIFPSSNSQDQGKTGSQGKTGAQGG